MNAIQSQEMDEQKRKARLAFDAYQEAVRAGDAELAEAARQRFLEASRHLKANRAAMAARGRE